MTDSVRVLKGKHPGGILLPNGSLPGEGSRAATPEPPRVLTLLDALDSAITDMERRGLSSTAATREPTGPLAVEPTHAAARAITASADEALEEMHTARAVLDDARRVFVSACAEHAVCRERYLALREDPRCEEREEQWRKKWQGTADALASVTQQLHAAEADLVTVATEGARMIHACAVQCGKTPHPCPACGSIMKLLTGPHWPRVRPTGEAQP